MTYEYAHFIPQNIAPTGATKIGVYDGNGVKVCDIPLGTLSPPTSNKLYSFGLLSDLHVDGVGNNGNYLSEAMTFFENQGCLFCCHAGDMTNVGFWTEAKDEIFLTQMAEYKSVIDSHPNLPMYGICGNHESYYKSITENLTELKAYTYRDLYYTYEHGNDVFIFLGQPWGTGVAYKDVWKEEFQFLYETLESNRNKRCFVFEHLTLTDDSGNPNDIHNAYLYDFEATLVGIMKHYKNAMLFHGHSHLYFSVQEIYSYAMYSTKKGFKSISIPSSGGSRIVDESGALIKTNNSDLRSGYIVDVYDDYIILRGYNFKAMEGVAIGTYKIDTTLQTVEANTFTDSTGTIVA